MEGFVGLIQGNDCAEHVNLLYFFVHGTWAVALPLGGVTSGSTSWGVRGCKFDYTEVEAISCAIQFLSPVAGELPADVCVSSKEIKHL